MRMGRVSHATERKSADQTLVRTERRLPRPMSCRALRQLKWRAQMTSMDRHTRLFIGVEVVVAETLSAGRCVADGSQIRRSRDQAATNWIRTRPVRTSHSCTCTCCRLRERRVSAGLLESDS